MTRYIRMMIGMGLIACSGDNAISTLPRDAAHTGNPTHLLQSMMADVGCSPAAPKSGRNEVTVPIANAAPMSFTCESATRDQIRQTISMFHAAVSPSRTPQMQTWYEDVVVYYQCLVTNHWTYVPTMGEYVFAYATVDGCWVTEIIQTGGGGGGGGGSWVDGNGDPTPAPSPAYDPPIQADTTCLDVTNDRQVLRRLAGTDYVAQGALNDLAIQDSLRAALADSYGTIQNPLPISQRREIGGVIVYDPNNHTYSFLRIDSEPQWESHCTYRMKDSKINGVVVGLFHTHPIRDGETYDCPKAGQYGLEANAEAQGGGSDQDWDTATDKGIPAYTIDPDRLWRLEPDTPQGLARTSNPQRWAATSNGSCSSPAPF